MANASPRQRPIPDRCCGFRWTGRGLKDLDRLEAFLFAKSPSAASRALAAIRAGAEQLRDLPDMGRLVPRSHGRYRELPVRFGESGYMLFYEVDRGDVWILAIKHFREEGYS